MAQLFGTLSRNQRVAGLIPGSRHIPKLRAQSLVRVHAVHAPHPTLAIQAHMGGNQSMLLPCINVSLPSSLSKSNEKMPSGEDKINKIKNKNIRIMSKVDVTFCTSETYE